MRKVSDRHRQWLMKELPLLENAGVLTPDKSNEIKAYYETRTRSGMNWAIIAFAVLGSLLIGSGIILLFAHNWDELTRPTRAVLSFVPLAIGIALSMTTLVRQGGVALRESAGIFHSLAVGATISLIGQTYHLSSNAPAFLMSWALLIMPLMFLLRSTGSYLIYLALVCGWSVVGQQTYGQAAGFWLLAVPPIARLIQSARKNLYNQETAIGFAGLIIAFCYSVAWALELAIPGLWVVMYSTLLSGVCLLGVLLFGDRVGWNNVPKSFGAIGVMVLTYILTWEDVWDEMDLDELISKWSDHSWVVWLDIGVTLVCISGWIYTAIRVRKHYSCETSTMAAFPVLTGFCVITGTLTNLHVVLYALLFNLFMLYFGTMHVVLGCRNGKLRQLNAGMAVLSLLLVTRFFDSGFGYLARGIVFIVLGAVFLSVNLIMIRRNRRKEVAA